MFDEGFQTEFFGITLTESSMLRFRDACSSDRSAFESFYSCLRWEWEILFVRTVAVWVLSQLGRCDWSLSLTSRELALLAANWEWEQIIPWTAQRQNFEADLLSACALAQLVATNHHHIDKAWVSELICRTVNRKVLREGEKLTSF